MQVTWVYSGDDGESHFAELEIPTSLDSIGGTFTDWIAVEGLLFRQPAKSFTVDFHCAPRRQFFIQLQGQSEIEVGDGTRRTLGPGEFVLVDDTEGHGHITRSLGAGRVARVSVPKSLDVAQWGASSLAVEREVQL